MGKQWSLSNKKSTGKSRKRVGDKHVSSSSFGGCMVQSFIYLISTITFPFINLHLKSLKNPICSSKNFWSCSLSDFFESRLFILRDRGVEAPRNSLELEEQEQEHMVEQVASSSSSSSLKLKQETNFNIPMRDIQIKTKRSRLTEDVSSECSSNSPCTKTPSLVARLMGLDLLPETSSPRPSSSSPRLSSSSSYATPLNHLSKLSSHKCNTHSLPTTPRVSTAPRPSTETDYHHRLSLQIGKENKRRYDESTSEYAKQIAKQVRENIARRIGTDITNTVKRKEHRRDEYLVVLKPKKPSSPSNAMDNKSRNLEHGHGCGKENYEPTPLSCSPRLRLLEIKNNLTKPNSNSLKCSSLSPCSEAIKPPPSSTTKPPTLLKEEEQLVKHEKPMKVPKCNRIASEKYDLRLKKMHQQEDQPPFTKKCNKKSTPLSNHLVKVNTSTKFISFKKDMASPSTTTLPQTQVPLASITQLPSCQSRSHNTKETHKLSTLDKVSTNGNDVPGATTTAGSSFSDHFDYISKILSHSGIEKTTLISISHWYSPSHPLHPSIFQQIEKHFYDPTGFTNRKLIFEVVDELLVEILKPYISLKPWAQQTQQTHQALLGPRCTERMYGLELVEKLCAKIKCFPEADCQVLEDIDGLIEGDMKQCTRVVRSVAFEEEAEELVAEMERDMVDTLVNEMAGIILHVGC